MQEITITREVTRQELESITGYKLKGPKGTRGPRPTPPKPNLKALKRRRIKQARRNNRG